MPDKRTHRGPHPEDRQLFAPDAWPRLRTAVNDLSWLLTRGYASASALRVVGDRYALDQRQRIAVARCACSDEARQRRDQSRVTLTPLDAQVLLIDGYNVLTSIEAALAGGVILKARDGCLVPAIQFIGQFLTDVGVSRGAWYFDSPVSNSGRLKTMLRKTAAEQGWTWAVELVPDPDKVLSQTDQLVATADSGILDVCCRWTNLACGVIERFIPNANIVDLSGITPGSSPS